MRYAQSLSHDTHHGFKGHLMSSYGLIHTFLSELGFGVELGHNQVIRVGPRPNSCLPDVGLLSFIVHALDV